MHAYYFFLCPIDSDLGIDFPKLKIIHNDLFRIYESKQKGRNQFWSDFATKSTGFGPKRLNLRNYVSKCVLFGYFQTHFTVKWTQNINIQVRYALECIKTSWHALSVTKHQKQP